MFRVRLAPVLLNQDPNLPPRGPAMPQIAFRFIDLAVVTLILSALT